MKQFIKEGLFGAVIGLAIGIAIVIGRAGAADQVAAAQTQAVPLPPAKPRPISQAQATTDPALILQQFTVTDLQAALADAQAQTPPDTIAATCYSALLTIVQAQSTGGNPLLPVGLFSGFQKARDTAALLANLHSPNGPLSSLNVACAPLVMSTQNTLIELGLLVGVVIK